MIPPAGEWTPFADHEDRINHYVLWGFSKFTRLVFYAGRFTDKVVPCEVLGHQNDKWAVIKVGEDLHCIHGEHLHELQSHHTKMDGIPSEYVAIDVESTSKYVPFAEIIEFGAIRYIDGKENAVYSSLIKPKHKIPAASIKVHHITDEDVCDAPAWEDVQGDILDFIGDLPIVGHNVLYDIEVLQTHCRRWIGNPYIDTMQRAKAAFPDGDPRTVKLGIKNYTLEHLKERLNLSANGSHRALDDIRTTNALLYVCEE